ncbi:hypothetical protein J6S88_01535 [bacterium]|nr:hypothetical protein [bacterium]
MDLSINNYPQHTPSFSARLDRRTQKAIMNGILTEVRKQPRWEPKGNSIGGEAVFNTLTDKADRIKKLLATKFGRGTFSLHNELGLSPKVTKLTFWDGRAFLTYDIPEEIQNEIKVVNKSNMFATKYKIMEFPANRLDWLYEFLAK